MTMQTMRLVRAALAALLIGAPTAAFGQPNCRNTGAFEPWLAAFKREAAATGISQAAIAAASPYLVLDQRIISIDRGQKFFAQNFLEISDKMLAGGRLPGGAAQMKKHQALFARQEKDFGVPASVITAFWGLESDFGAGQGKDHAIKSLVTLAYDCRRSDMFRGHSLDSLRLIERGDLRAEEMIGSWAGELGQTQMMPSEYMAHAIDYDGDGTAQSDQERAGRDRLDRKISRPSRLEARRAVAAGDPRPRQPALEGSRPVGPASALEVGGLGRDARRRQAAAERRYAHLRGASARPVRTGLPRLRQFPGLSEMEPVAQLFLDGGLLRDPPRRRAAMSRGSPNIPKITFEETRELQQLLEKRGYDVGRIDGVLGLKSRIAIRDAQSKLGMPADGWPTAELLAALRGGSTAQRPAAAPAPAPTAPAAQRRAPPAAPAMPFHSVGGEP